MEQYSLAELTQLIQKTFKDHLEPSYWVVSEIGEISVNQKGHCYLELLETEDDKIIAKSRATIWSYTYSNLSTWFQGITGQPLSKGMKILANVKITFHEVYGFSLNIQDIDANYTIGEKERQKQEVINKLVADGVMDMNKELSLPIVPKRVSVISSPTAAGYGDFLEHLNSNLYGYEIHTELYPAIMQGDDAPASIIQSLLEIVNKDASDLVVLIRGGGSQLDLDCFNDYDLCSHMAQFPIPIITGIGHERDDTIADMVANTKQKTPTAVAEFILQGFMAYESRIEEAAIRISRATQNLIHSASLRLDSLISRIGLNAKSTLDQQQLILSASANSIRLKSLNQVNMQGMLIERIEGRHSDLNPGNVLKRGYTFTTINRKSIFVNKAKKSDKMITYSKDQIIKSTVTETRKNDEI